MTQTSAAARVAETHREVRRPTRPTLHPVHSPQRRPHRGEARGVERSRRRISPVAMAASFVVASLLAVVGGNMVLVSGQLQLSQVQNQLANQQSVVAAAEASVFKQTAPGHIANEASLKGLTQVTPLLIPAVTSLDVREHAPTFSPSPCCSVTPGT
jgi:hypothetical protein